MVEWSASDDRIYGYGETERVSIEVRGWAPGNRAPPITSSVDAIAVGRTRAIRLPSTDVTPTDARGPLRERRLPEGVHRLSVEASLEPRVAFEGPATVDPSDDGAWIRFLERRPVAIGFHESDAGRPTVTVSPTPEGLATAVTAAGRTHRTAGPARSHPGFRPRTPRVRFGERSIPDRLDAPDSGQGRTARTGGVTMTVPDSTTAVLVAAPLSYYLGATLRTGAEEPRLVGPGIDHSFEPLPAFACQASRALRLLCRLDERLRDVPGETGPTIPEGDEKAALEAASPTERLASALALERPGPLPEWPLSTYVSDDVRNGRYLPYLLDRLSLVHPASASELDPNALLKRSLEEFYRGEAPNVEAVDPVLADSRYHAWLADGTPVDAHTLLGARGPTDGFEEHLAVDVVCNDPEMRAERDVAGVYRRRLAGLDATVRVHERLPRADLKSVFERSTTLVHFIGHCELDGLVCPDGPLAAEELESCGAETVFLNACGSYYEGYDLVRKGATVSAVTLTTVFDEHAVSVGTTFAELLASGFAFERALSLARSEILTSRDYAVVGDGAHRIRPPGGTPAVLFVESADGEFDVRYDALAPDSAGRRYRDPVRGAERACGSQATATLQRDELAELLGLISVPVRYDGEFARSETVARDIANGR